MDDQEVDGRRGDLRRGEDAAGGREIEKRGNLGKGTCEEEKFLTNLFFKFYFELG